MKFLIPKLSIILFILTFNLNAQITKVDSLKQLLLNSTEDTTQILLLNNIALEYANLNIDSAWFYIKKAQIINNKLKYSYAEAMEIEYGNELLIANDKFKKEKLKRANYLKLTFIIIIVAIIIIIILIRNRKKLKKSNQLITKKNKIIADQNAELQQYQVLLEEKINKRTDQLETALIKSTENDHLKSEFIENISHEIREPMNVIQGFSEILEVNNKNIDEDHANIIQENIDHLLNLMDDLLELSKFKSGQYKLNITTFSILRMLKDIKTEVLSKRNMLKKEHVEINFDFDNSLPEKFTNDENKINKILNELLNNALKYTDHGNIEISCEFKDNNLIIIIKDTGIGIKQEKLPYIFDPFSKINVEEKRYRGTGIGLSVANSNITALNGSIKASSSKGEGSIFTIVIPNFSKQNTLT
ncbi:MAG: HAMP domain-containing sensor histidine kinase [Bacteroidota bacterium]